MTTTAVIADILKRHGVEEFAFLPFDSAVCANKRLWEQCSTVMKSCIILLFPYKTEYTIKDSYVLSSYSRTYDYHKRCAQFFDEVIPELKQALHHEFVGYADHSPIGEKSAAAKCGLGVLGKNTLLINKRYGSYIFIASILTDMVLESDECEPKGCIGCGRCATACPGGAIGPDGYDYEKCLSYISQKKVKTAEERELLAKNRIVWGCDVCQDVCPMNADVQPCRDEYFASGVIDNVSLPLIEQMSDEEFARYPFSWRKKQVITDNFKSVID